MAGAKHPGALNRLFHGPALAFVTLVALVACAPAKPPEPAPPPPPAAQRSPAEQLTEAARREERARELLVQTAFKDALRDAQLALEIDQRLLGEGAARTLRVIELIAEIHVRAGHLDLAEAALLDAYHRRERAPERTGADLSRSALALADFYTKKGDLALPEKYALLAISLAEEDKEPEPAALAAAEEHLGAHYLDRCRLAEAGAPLEEARALREKAGPDGAAPLAAVLRRIATLQFYLRQDDASDATLRKALSVVEGREKEAPEAVLASLDQLGDLLEVRSRPAEERKIRERAATVAQTALGPTALRALDETARLIRFYRRAGEPVLAEDLVKTSGIVAYLRKRPVQPGAAAGADRCSPRVPGYLQGINAAATKMAPLASACYDGVRKEKKLNFEVNLVIHAVVSSTGDMESAEFFLPASVPSAFGDCLLDSGMTSRFPPTNGRMAVNFAFRFKLE